MNESLLPERVFDCLSTVLDPELGINIVDLGLVYDVSIDGGKVSVKMTMTSPACPLGQEIAREAEDCLNAIDGVQANVMLVWNPPWGPERLSSHAKTLLGWTPI